MAAVVLRGMVLPRGLTINLRAPDTKYEADDGTLSGIIDVSVVNSDVVVTWETDEYRPEMLPAIFFHATRISKALVNLVAFRMGAAASLMLDSYTLPDAKTDTIAIVEPAVAGLSPSLESDAGLLSIFGILAAEQHLMMVMEDLIAGLWSQPHKVINCARCVEALRQLVAGGRLSPKAQWPIFNDMLNLERSYLDLIMAHSTEPRHGKEYKISDEEVAEIVRRTWTITNRFFEYRLGANKKLEEKTFPVLRG